MTKMACTNSSCGAESGGGSGVPAIKPPVIYKTSLLVMAAGKFFLWPNTAPIFSSWKEALVLGTSIFVPSVQLALNAKKIFKHTNTPMMGGPISGSSPLHTSGVFSWTRNPMYLGISTALTGAAIGSNCWYHLAFPVLNVLIMNGYYIPKEERDMEKEFGMKYLDYKNRVPRWI